MLISTSVRWFDQHKFLLQIFQHEWGHLVKSRHLVEKQCNCSLFKNLQITMSTIICLIHYLKISNIKSQVKHYHFLLHFYCFQSNLPNNFLFLDQKQILVFSSKIIEHVFSLFLAFSSWKFWKIFKTFTMDGGEEDAMGNGNTPQFPNGHF